MPRGRKPQGDQAISNAERQALWRARHQGNKPAPAVRYRRPADRRSRPQRWNDAAAERIAVQAECAAWWEAMPEGLRDTPTAEALRAIVELDLDAITSVEPPRGFGRD